VQKAASLTIAQETWLTFAPPFDADENFARSIAYLFGEFLVERRVRARIGAVHARQLKALCRRVGRTRMSRQGPGRSPSMGLTHLNAARPREKSSGVPHCGSSKILSDLVSHRHARTSLH
jgi:hypothetical protein